MKKRKKIIIGGLIICLIALLIGGGIWWVKTQNTPDPAESIPDVTVIPVGQETLAAETESSVGEEEPSGEAPETEPAGTDIETEPAEISTAETSQSPENPEHPKAPELDYLEGFSVPEYSGKAYILINDGQPFFDTEVLTPESYEIYYDLDDLGRCTLADAVVGVDLMPTEKRGSLSSIKPTGWHSDRYPKDLVDGEALYNRCHLIAFGLCGETTNKYNLVTGTRYFNTKGVNSFENMVIDYVRETENHVRYRVTPIWTGDNLICDGQIIEAWSIEDEGEAICFNIYAYNVQPGIVIDYATGDNWLDGEYAPARPNQNEESDTLPTLAEDYEDTFILNVKKKKIHTTHCPGASSMSEKNRQEYTGSYNALILEGYEPDSACLSN